MFTLQDACLASDTVLPRNEHGLGVYGPRPLHKPERPNQLWLLLVLCPFCSAASRRRQRRQPACVFLSSNSSAFYCYSDEQDSNTPCYTLFSVNYFRTVHCKYWVRWLGPISMRYWSPKGTCPALCREITLSATEAWASPEGWNHCQITSLQNPLPICLDCLLPHSWEYIWATISTQKQAETKGNHNILLCDNL